MIILLPLKHDFDVVKIYFFLKNFSFLCLRACVDVNVCVCVGMLSVVCVYLWVCVCVCVRGVFFCVCLRVCVSISACLSGYTIIVVHSLLIQLACFSGSDISI